MERFNFVKEYKLFNACSIDDRFRNAMMMVHFINGYAYASDSHILVRVPLSSCTSFIEGEEEWKRLNGFSIHWRVLKTIYGYNNIRVERDDDAGTCHIVTDIEGHAVSFKLQRTEDVHPLKFEEVLARNEAIEPVKRIGINPHLLLKLAEAINLKNVGLYFRGERNAIRIENKLDGSVAIIMPRMLSDED